MYSVDIRENDSVTCFESSTQIWLTNTNIISSIFWMSYIGQCTQAEARNGEDVLAPGERENKMANEQPWAGTWAGRDGDLTEIYHGKPHPRIHLFLIILIKSLFLVRTQARHWLVCQHSLKTLPILITSISRLISHHRDGTKHTWIGETTGPPESLWIPPWTCSAVAGSSAWHRKDDSLWQRFIPVTPVYITNHSILLETDARLSIQYRWAG
jgi:hypothetical protein